MICETKSLGVPVVLTLLATALFSTVSARSDGRESIRSSAADATKALPDESLRSPLIRSLRTTAHFSEDSSAKRWNAAVFGKDGKPVYTMFLLPEYGPKRAIVGVDLVLRYPGVASDSNLFNPHNSHGLQPWMFAGRDLARGADKSVYGDHRELKHADEHLLVEINIREVKTSSLDDGWYQLAEIELAIIVRNVK